MNIGTWNLRRPHSNYRKGPRKCTQRRKSLREQLPRIKAENSGVKREGTLPKLREMAAHRLIVRENVVIEEGSLA